MRSRDVLVLTFFRFKQQCISLMSGCHAISLKLGSWLTISCSSNLFRDRHLSPAVLGSICLWRPVAACLQPLLITDVFTLAKIQVCGHEPAVAWCLQAAALSNRHIVMPPVSCTAPWLLDEGRSCGDPPYAGKRGCWWHGINWQASFRDGCGPNSPSETGRRSWPAVLGFYFTL